MLKASLNGDIDLDMNGVLLHIPADEEVTVDVIRGVAYYKDLETPFEIQPGEYSVEQ